MESPATPEDCSSAESYKPSRLVCSRFGLWRSLPTTQYVCGTFLPIRWPVVDRGRKVINDCLPRQLPPRQERDGSPCLGMDRALIPASAAGEMRGTAFELLTNARPPLEMMNRVRRCSGKNAVVAKMMTTDRDGYVASGKRDLPCVRTQYARRKERSLWKCAVELRARLRRTVDTRGQFKPIEEQSSRARSMVALALVDGATQPSRIGLELVDVSEYVPVASCLSPQLVAHPRAGRDAPRPWVHNIRATCSRFAATDQSLASPSANKP
jgi:hypothetical protein